MEGEGRFNRFDISQERRVETPEQQFRGGLRREAERIRWETINPEAREIAIKVAEKIDLKDQLDDVVAHRDNTAIYQKMKQLGVFFAVDTEARTDWQHEESEFSVQRGDSVLDLHLPPLKPEQRDLSEVTRSLGLIADYIVEQRLQPKYVMGITYERLARASRRQGFTVVDVPIPAEIQRGVQRVHDRFTEGKDMGKIFLCFQPTDQFLQRYHRPQEATVYKK